MRMLFLYMLAAIAFSQTPDYFPLQVGNQWVYRVTGRSATNSIVVEVTGQQTAGDHAYFTLRGFPSGQMLVRVAEDGKLAIFNPATNREETWVDFGAPQGSSFASAIDTCTQQGTLDSGSTHFEGPLGAFDNALVVKYSGRCADAGLEKEVFLPWIGLVQRTETTIAGPLTYNLVYAALGGVTFAAEPQLSFSLSVANRMARMTLRNTQTNPVAVAFPSGQDFDLVLKDQSGTEVYRWSAGKMFTQIFRNLQITGEKNWVAVIPDSVPDGRYTAEAFLSTAPPGQYTASVAIELKSK